MNIISKFKGLTFLGTAAIVLAIPGRSDGLFRAIQPQSLDLPNRSEQMLSSPKRIVSVRYDADIIDVRAVNPRMVKVIAKAPGKANIVMFVARDSRDAIGEVNLYNVTVIDVDSAKE